MAILKFQNSNDKFQINSKTQILKSKHAVSGFGHSIFEFEPYLLFGFCVLVTTSNIPLNPPSKGDFNPRVLPFPPLKGARGMFFGSIKEYESNYSATDLHRSTQISKKFFQNNLRISKQIRENPCPSVANKKVAISEFLDSQKRRLP